MASKPHVVVIGAGTLGMATAVNLIERDAQVTVLEANSIASGSSGRSVGVLGTQVTDPFEIRIRTHSFRQFGAWEKGGLRINHIGYLRLARTEAQMEVFAKSVALQTELGFTSRLCRPQDIRAMIPHMSLDGLAGGLFGPNDSFLDPHELCVFLAERLRAQGGVLRQSCKVEGVKRVAGGYELATAKGGIRCDMVVNAAGAWASRVAALFGQTLHVTPERHEAIVVHLDRPLDYTMPMVMDLVNGEGTGLNFRHEKPGELIAEVHQVTSWTPEDPDLYNDQCDEASKYNLAKLLLERVPDLPGASLGRG